MIIFTISRFAGCSFESYSTSSSLVALHVDKLGGMCRYRSRLDLNKALRDMILTPSRNRSMECLKSISRIHNSAQLIPGTLGSGDAWQLAADDGKQ